MIFFASAHTSRARVESSPPEIPMTRFRIPVARTLVASPLAWICNILWQRASLAAPSAGTNGFRGIGCCCSLKTRAISSIPIASPPIVCIRTGTLRYCDRLPFSNVFCRLLSCMIIPRSTSAFTAFVPFGKIPSLRILPHCAIMQCPENTRSVLLSPCPEDAYAYAQLQAPLC